MFSLNLSILDEAMTSALPVGTTCVLSNHTPTSGDTSIKFNSIYIGPSKGEAGSVPLIGMQT